MREPLIVYIVGLALLGAFFFLVLGSTAYMLGFSNPDIAGGVSAAWLVSLVLSYIAGWHRVRFTFTAST